MNARNLLLGVTLAVASGAFAVTDELGKTPDYWMTFENTSKALEQCGAKTAAFYNDPNAKPVFVEIDSGHAVSNQNYFTAGTPLTLGADGSWTIVSRLSAPAAKSILWGLGTVTTSPGAIALLHQGSDVIAVGQGTAASGYTVLIEATVPLAKGHFHNYAVVANGATQKIALYVDGKKVGEAAYDGASYKSPHFQFASTHGGKHPSWANGDNMLLDDWRVYAEALSAEDVAEIAKAQPFWPSDEAGYYPTYWLKFQGDRSQSGYKNAYFYQFQSDTGVFVTETDGLQSYSNTTAWTSSDMTLGKKGWTVSTIVRCASFGGTKRSTLFDLGNPSSTKALVLALASDKSVVLSGCQRANDVSTQADDFVLAPVPDATTAYHLYTVTYDRATSRLSLYVDDTLVGSRVDASYALDSYAFQFSSILGGSGATCYAQSVYANCWRDWRVYDRALTAEEVGKFAAARGLAYKGDVIDSQPALRVVFDDDFKQSGYASPVTINQDGKTPVYTTTSTGKKACTRMSAFTSKITCGIDRSWTCAFVARIASTTASASSKKVVLDFGYFQSEGGFVISQTGKNTLAVDRLDGTATATPVMTATVKDMGELYHAYALSYDRLTKTLSFYCNGELLVAQENVEPLADAGAQIQFSSVLGGCPSGFSAAPNDNSWIEWSLYRHAITADQAMALAHREKYNRFGCILIFK